MADNYKCPSGEIASIESSTLKKLKRLGKLGPT